jgi:hypothetical protein
MVKHFTMVINPHSGKSLLAIIFLGHYDTQHNDIQHNNISITTFNTMTFSIIIIKM